VTDQELLSAGRHNIEACVQLAQAYGLGIEVMAFAFPDVLEGDWQSLVIEYAHHLRYVPGKLAMHGPFMDMAPGSPDPLVNQVCIERYQHAIRIAADLGVELIVFHANFIANIHTMEYRMGWHRRNLNFWGPMADYARRHGVMLAVENMWEYDPYIIGDVIKELAHPNLRACLDVGHAHLFGETAFDEWLVALDGMIVHTHMNNNDGKIDIHMGLNHGALDYHTLLPHIRALSPQPSITLEMDDVTLMKASLSYLELGKPEGQPGPSLLSSLPTPSSDA
jgi:sugar phosphate isomerase/epimerase